MRTCRRSRAIGTVAVAIAVAALATGCSLPRGDGEHGARQTVTPRVGDCWSVSYADAAQSEDWTGRGPVACSAKHESYTYAVTRLTRKFTGSWLDGNGKPRADVDDAAFTACLSRERALLPGITPKEALFYPTYYLPSVAQWDGGARWVRCDMTMIRVGSEVAKPSLATLPARFSSVVTALKSNPRRFALCEDDVFNNGPDGDGTTYADCTRPADWTFEVRLSLPYSDSAPYPGSEQLKALGDQKCEASVKAPVGHDVVAKVPAESSWDEDGVRAVDCWLNNN